MSIIKEFLELDITAWVLSVFVIMSGFIAIYEIIGKFSAIIKKPVFWVKNKERDHELLIKTVKNLAQLHEKHENDTKQSIRHDEMIKEDLKKLADTVNSIAISLEEMENKNNATKVKELKDSLVNYYNKYRVIGEWSKLEKEAFWDLFEDYEKRGGDGFVHTIVEPVMRELKEVEE